MKRLFKEILLGSVMFIILLCVHAAADTVTYSGTTDPEALVSFLLIAGDADFADLSEDDIIRTEIVTADKDGNYSQSFELNDIQYDNNGKILNYKLKSNIKSIDINSGAVSGKVAIKQTRVIDGVVYVPIYSTFEKLGIGLVYDSASGVYTGRGNNGDITITIGKNTFEVNYVTIELPGEVIFDGTNGWMPLYLVEDAAKVSAPRYDEQTQTAYIDIPDQSQASPDEFNIGDVVKDHTGTTILSQSKIYNKPSISNSCGASVDLKNVSISGQGFSNALQITSSYPNGVDSQPVVSDLRLIWTISDGSLPAGNVGVLSFKARAIDLQDGASSANIRVYVEKSNGDVGTGLYEKALSEDVVISKGGWQQFYFPVYHSAYSMDKDHSKFMLYIGGNPIKIQIADLSLINYGTKLSIDDIKPDASRPYKGMEDDALWRKEAYRRIEKYRKEDLQISVVDESGNPVPDADISVDMTEGEFMFGVALNKKEVVGLSNNTQSGRIYNNLLNNDFNTGVCGLEMKPRTMTATSGTDAVQMANEYFSRGMRMRGHAILWDDDSTVHFSNYNDMTYEEIYRQMIDYAGPVARMFKGKLAQWDVINEPADSNHVRVTFDTTRLYTDLFNLIHEIDPDVKLYVNETGIEGSKGYYVGDPTVKLVDFVNRLKKEGAHIDGIGIQTHCKSYNYPQGFYNQLDYCAQAVDEISVTEYDLLNDNMDYADEHLRDTLLATFSHPKATAFIVWGVQDTEHWRKYAPFYDSSWNERPAKKIWSDMVNKEFATHEKLVTDTHGNAVLRAYRGDYDIKVTANGKTTTARLKVLDDTDNNIKFVVSASGISASASNIPDDSAVTMDFATLDEAKAAFEEEYSERYTGILLESNFKGIESQSLVLKGNASANDKYNQGKVWGSASGASAAVSSGDKYSVILRSASSSFTADIRHKTYSCTRYPETDLYFETIFETMSASAQGEYCVGLSVKGDSAETLAKLVYKNGSYSITNVGGTTFASLDKNKQYSLKISIDRKTGKVRFVLYSGNSQIKSASLGDVSNLTGENANEIIYNISSSITGTDNIFMLYNARLCSFKDSCLILFDDSDRTLYEVDEEMKNFDFDSVSEIGSSQFSVYDEDGWARKRTKNISDGGGFEYSDNGHYVYTVAKNNSDTQILAKNFTPVLPGEKMTFEYGMYLDGAEKWEDFSGRGTISLANADNSYMIDITQFEYNKYTGYKLSTLRVGGGDYKSAETVHNGVSEGYNWNNLTVTSEFVPQTDGTYNITVTIKNNVNTVLKTVNVTGVSAENVQKLTGVYITAYSAYSTVGQKKICGFRDIRVLKSGLTIDDDNVKIIRKGDSLILGIMYNNVTGRIHDANIAVAAYKGDSMIGYEIKPCVIKSGVGSLNFKIDTVNPDAEYYKVILIDDINNLVPYKSADKLVTK